MRHDGILGLVGEEKGFYLRVGRRTEEHLRKETVVLKSGWANPELSLIFSALSPIALASTMQDGYFGRRSYVLICLTQASGLRLIV